MIPENYLEKTYAGFLAKCIGIRLGAPVEPALWDMDRIRKTYGYIDRYVKPYRTFAADDDSNGPAYFIRALIDDAPDGNLTPQAVAKAWLNYAREGVGMFWWGGYGISTEHTAYMNLKNGIDAPLSGSIRQNGNIIAEQIGGQIFIDTFGMVNPANPHKAADFGEIAASVSHDGEGLYGARFFTAAIAAAYATDDIGTIIETALREIPSDSDYYAVARFVKDFHEKEGSDFLACARAVLEAYPRSKYKGNCHIIYNAGICFTALYYGDGDLARTIEIAVNCGEDTDCNAGNVATVMGIAKGIGSIPEKYRDPINDGIVLSGVSGYLNTLDLPTFAKEICLLGYKVAGEEAPAELVASYRPGELFFDFELPGSVHNFRASDNALCQLRHTDEIARGKGALEIIYSQFYRGQTCRIFHKTFWTRDDFSDERYMPVFAPQVASGQKVSFEVFNEQWTGLSEMGINPYVHTINGNIFVTDYLVPPQGEWNVVEFTVPDTAGEIIDEVGFIMEGLTKKADRCRGRLFVDNFRAYGKASYSVDFSKQRVDFGSITPLSHSMTAWRKVGATVQNMRMKESISYTGNYYGRNESITIGVTAHNGIQHLVGVRCPGLMRGYYAGFDGEGKVSILKNDFGITSLASAPYSWEYGRKYDMCLKAENDELVFYIDGERLLSATDTSFPYGMVAFGSVSMGRTDFENLRIESEV